MHVHILGVCGTFMAGIARLASELGATVTGADANAWPPMSDQLRELGVGIHTGYDAGQLDSAPDITVVGNALTRGQPVVERLLNEGLRYTSGPDWLCRQVLANRWVLAVSGTHGKTTTSAMLAWVLESVGLEPGFLIGGVPENFGVSARLGSSKYFVIEADEYDTAFFDKRSKFVHYRPRTLVINNIEHDHADIFPDLESILHQFHHLVRIVPEQGAIIHPYADDVIDVVLDRGCWSDVHTFGGSGEWQAVLLTPAGERFDVMHRGEVVARVEWSLIGQHNVMNALATFAAASEVQIAAPKIARALATFKNVKRRLEVRGVVNDVTVYDDFAHHPTAIASTIAGLRAKVGTTRIVALLDPRSNSMRAGLHQHTLANSLSGADLVWMLADESLNWDAGALVRELGARCVLADSVDLLVSQVVQVVEAGDHVLVMSNGAFGHCHQKLLEALEDTDA